MIKLIAMSTLGTTLATKEISKAKYSISILLKFKEKVSQSYGSIVAVKVVR